MPSVSRVFAATPGDCRQTTCGLLVQSRRGLPGLPPFRPGAAVDPIPLDVFLAAEPEFPEKAAEKNAWHRVLDGTVEDETGRPLLVLDRRDDLYRFSYLDGTTFWLDHRGRRLWVRWPPSSSLENATIYMTGPVLGLALRLRGYLPLHAASVAVGEKAVLFVGPPRAGKSTLAAAFALAGHRVLADDTTVIRRVEEGSPEAVPDTPRIRLWPESTPLLFGRSRPLPPLTPGWEKGRFDLAEASVQSRPLPLSAIYFLEGEADEDDPAGASPVSGPEVVVRLAANLSVPGFPDPAIKSRELHQLSRLASRIPAFRWARPPGQGPESLVRHVECSADAAES